MPGLDNAAVSDGNKDANRPPAGGPAFEGYPRAATPASNGDRVTGNIHTDASRTANDSSDAQPGTTLRPDQVAFLKSWREKEKAVAEFNAKNDGDGGAHLQNAVYDYTKQILKQEGLDKAGWEAYPVAMNSPLDKIGADIVLVNSKTGAMVFMDPTSRRLDPKTGERASAADNAKTNVPAIREPGVVDALPRWFERGLGLLDVHQDDPAMRQSVLDFKAGFPTQLRNLTSQPAPFNLKDFPLPYYGPVKDQAVAVGQIQNVIDWSAQTAAKARGQGDYARAGDLQEFGKTINGALNFTKRTGSEPLQAAMERSVNRVIADEALRRAYPNLAPALPNGVNKVQRLEGGSVIQTDKNGTLVLNLQGNGQSGQDQVITAGSVPDAFEKATGYWASAAHDPQRMAEFKALLPKSVVQQIDAGKVDIRKILAEIGDNRNIFAGGGAGVEKPLVARVVTRLANQKAEGLRKMVTEAAAEVTTPVEKAPHPAVKVTAPVEKAPPPAAKTTNGDARPGQAETSYGRPQPGPNGTKWEPGRAPAPVVGKVDRPAEVAAAAAVPKAVEQPDHLTPDEVEVIQYARKALESKGQANLNAGDREQIASFRFAEEQLTKPFGNDPVKRGIVDHIREMMGSEVKGAALSMAMISIAVLNYYQAHKSDVEDTSRPKFY